MFMNSEVSKFSFRERLASFTYAFRGLYHILKYEHNSRIHLLAAIMALALGAVFHISLTEWLIIILCIGLVFLAEITNTAIEMLVDMISPQKNEKAGRIKDIAAGGVLVASMVSLVAGIIVFLPYLV
jgi:diacylglycerol kinase